MENKKSSWTIQNSFRRDLGAKHPPSWPNEMLVKLCSSKGYSKLTRAIFKEKVKVCELGCFSGNNLRFFIESGFDIRGVEINKEMIQLGKENLTRLGYEVPETREGNNLSIPYDDNFFDMFVCINTIHYVFGLDIYKALEEYKRVVKDGGVVVVETPAEKHFAKESATRCDEFSWKWEAEGFRKGQTFGFFDSKDHFRQTLKKHFSEVEIHRRTEETELTSLDFYIGVCKV